MNATPADRTPSTYTRVFAPDRVPAPLPTAAPGAGFAAGMMNAVTLGVIALLGFIPVLSLIAVGVAGFAALVAAVASHGQPPVTIWLRASGAALVAVLLGGIAFALWYAHAMQSFTF